VLNTNGASEGNSGKAGGGGDKGDWICSFGESMRVSSSMKAVLRGLRLAKTLEINKLWVQVDSFVLVGLLKDESNSCAEHAPILNQCKEIIKQQGWEALISHCFREANKVTDALANIGCNLVSSYVIYDFPLPEVREVLFADSIEVGWPRMMPD